MKENLTTTYFLTMITWHRKRCHKADVVLAGQLPFCCSCDHSPSDVDLGLFQSLGPPKPPSSSQEGLNLPWPSSVSYNTESILDEDGTDLTPQLLSIVHGARTEESNIGEYQEPPSSDPKSTSGYEPRNSGRAIRLLCLSKGVYDDPLHGSLVLDDLNNPRSFEAISYVWADDDGDSTRNNTLFLGDRWDILPITKNCEAALRRFRLLDKERILWIDAVCINQADVGERSHQVGLMRQIYSTANTCLVYLGEHNESSRRAMELLCQAQLPQQITTEMSEALTSLFGRPYFTRTWILQELVSSRNILVYCGNMDMNWRQVISKHWGQYPSIKVPSWVQNFEIALYQQPVDFPRWIFEAGPLAASDARDKIFAILGLFRGLDDLGLIPDYSLSMVQVYTGVAAYLLQELGVNKILTLSPSPTAGLPSWVPDWRSVKPFQWDADHRVSNALSAKIAQRWPQHDEVIRLSLLPLNIKVRRDEPYNPCYNSTVMVHQRTGGLLISPEYLVPIKYFLIAGLCKWEFVSSGLASIPEDYIGWFGDFEFLFLLRKLADTHVYRIIGHCDICLPSTQFIGTSWEKPVVFHTQISQDELDPVDHWVTRDWSVDLWDAYINLAATTPNASFGTREWMRLLSAAHSEYKLLRQDYPHVGSLYKKLASCPSTIVKSYPRASQLVECIRFWSYNETWDSVRYIRNRLLQPRGTFDRENWKSIILRRKRWPATMGAIWKGMISIASIDVDYLPEIIGNLELAVELAVLHSYKFVMHDSTIGWNPIQGYFPLADSKDPVARLSRATNGLAGQRKEMVKEVILDMMREYKSVESSKDCGLEAEREIIKHSLLAVAEHFSSSTGQYQMKALGIYRTVAGKQQIIRQVLVYIPSILDNQRAGMNYSTFVANAPFPISIPFYSRGIFEAIEDFIRQNRTAKLSHIEVKQILESVTAEIEEGLVEGDMYGLGAIFNNRFQTSMGRVPLPDFSYIIDCVLLINDEVERQYEKEKQEFEKQVGNINIKDKLPLPKTAFNLPTYGVAFSLDQARINNAQDKCTFIQSIIDIMPHMTEGEGITII